MARKTLTEKVLPLFEAETDLEQKISALRSLKTNVLEAIKAAQNELESKNGKLQSLADELHPANG